MCDTKVLTMQVVHKFIFVVCSLPDISDDNITFLS